MAGPRACINIYVPAVSNFSELTEGYGGGSAGGIDDGNGNGNGNAIGDGGGGCPVQLPCPMSEDKSDPPKVGKVHPGQGIRPGVCHGLDEGESEGEGSGRSLYVVDAHGRILGHVRYQGDDYRSALRAAFNATPSHWKK